MPWQRLVREWLVYAAIMTVIFVLFFSESGLIGALAGLFVSGPLYLGLGAVLAKLGYRRKTIKELRAERTSPPSARSGSDDGHGSTAASRPRPAPTKRTSSGPTNRPRSKRRR